MCSGPGREETDTTVDVFTALSDPTRRAIVDELAERNDLSLFAICSRLLANHQIASSRQAISQHLAVLESAGLVRARRDGRYKLHRLDLEPLREAVRRWLGTAW